MSRTEDLRVKGMHPIVAPEDLKRVFPMSERAMDVVAASRHAFREVMYGRNPRLVVVVGPCSIHDADAALDYARRLAALSVELEDQLLVVMRAYFEKPRTTVGWKGLINDPDLDGSYRVSKGLGIARRLLSEIADLGLAVATETLGTINPQYLADLISWGCIGARTSESQIHRELVSGLSFPVGIKNSTDGNLQHAIDAIQAADHSHRFLGITHEGRVATIETAGNPDVHIVLRGGNQPNYHPAHIAATETLLAAAGLPQSLIVDCSHGNSRKDHTRQEEVATSVVDQVAAGNRSIFGFMLESFLEEGNQTVGEDPSQLDYGISITDKCIDWPTTEGILRDAHRKLQQCGGRQLG